MSAGRRILVVDDEPDIVDVVSMAPRHQGFEGASAATGQEAISQVTAFRPHLMVLDVMLFDMEGFEVAERIGAQRAGVPIVFLTARETTPDRVRGLTAGGDDYVTEPFSLEELVARGRAILRRTGGAAPESRRLVSESLEMDEDTREVTRAGQLIELTATEYRCCATSRCTRATSSRADRCSTNVGPRARRAESAAAARRRITRP